MNSLREDTPDHSYEFVGGPYNGRHLEVNPPPTQGIELVVHAVGRPVLAEFYVLQNDGRFHYRPGASQVATTTNLA